MDEKRHWNAHRYNKGRYFLQFGCLCRYLRNHTKNAQIFIDSRRILLFGCKELVLTQAAKLKKIASFIVSVFVPMSFLIHLNPRTTEGPDKMLFLRDVVLDYKRINDELVEVIRKMFLKHFHAWMNPTNVALNIQFKILAYKIDHLKNPDQSLPESVDIEALALKRIPMKSFYSKASKQAPSVHAGNITFWNSVDNHNRNGEQFIVKMWKCLFQRNN